MYICNAVIDGRRDDSHCYHYRKHNRANWVCGGYHKCSVRAGEHYKTIEHKCIKARDITKEAKLG